MLSESEAREIEAVANNAMLVATRSQGITAPDPADFWLHMMRDALFTSAKRLRALLPREEELEEVVEAVIGDARTFVTWGGETFSMWISDLGLLARLRAALARRKEGK